jgi:plasmid maintenance system antidote protein VapI
MKTKGIYKNLESLLKVTKITRQELLTVLPFNVNTLTRKLNGKTDITIKEACIIRDYIHKKAGILFDIEYLFEV